ncbi:MAG: epoxyqueuosine reductase QueH [Desulfuromonadaceae bacterium]|nr:epoxyqueuosine reductase QueH [Desulfuromonadaceae bacterium]
MNDNDRILLHVCCAPCATSCLERLAAAKKRVTLFFANSNIAPAEEYYKRLQEVFRLSKLFSTPLEVDDYDHDAWLRSIAGLENEPEKGARCRRCFGFSFARTQNAAESLGLPAFTTTLTVSPHKSSSVLFEIGKDFPRFTPCDFKKKEGFRRSLQLSRHFALYRQNFCGCEFSREDRR